MLCLYSSFETIASVLGVQSEADNAVRRRPYQFSIAPKNFFCLLSRNEEFLNRFRFGLEADTAPKAIA
jgi:hypothetical protein